MPRGSRRWVGTLPRELLEHVIVLGERHLLRQYVDYYNQDRPRVALRRDAPIARAAQPPSAGKVVPSRSGDVHLHPGAARVTHARVDTADAEIRAALDRHWAASNAGDDAGEGDIYRDDVEPNTYARYAAG
jgi:hypothetical protein